MSSSLLPQSAHCRALESPNPLTVFLAAFILVGVIVSYLPQHAKIITNHTSAGLSPWWVLLGGLSSIAALANILTLPASRADMKCCKELTGSECAAALLGVAQIGLQWGCFMFIVMLFLMYFPTDTEEVDLSSSTASLTKSPPSKRRDQLIVGGATLLALFVVGITSIALVAAYPHHTQNWANFLGTVAGVLATIQYLPQIYYTWRLGEIKSLSIITMLIQVPGAFLFAFSLWLRVGFDGWSTWLMFVITGVLQGILLGLAISYWIAGRKSGDGDHSPSEQSAEDVQTDGLASPDHTGSPPNYAKPTERTALLSNGSSRRHRGNPRSISGGRGGSSTGTRQFSMLYSATPPDQDSDPSSEGRI